jgi:hypothetical protein
MNVIDKIVVLVFLGVSFYVGIAWLIYTRLQDKTKRCKDCAICYGGLCVKTAQAVWGKPNMANNCKYYIRKWWKFGRPK